MGSNPTLSAIAHLTDRAIPALGLPLVRSRTFECARSSWEWFYYGRPQVPKNRFRWDHWIESGKVLGKTNADWGAETFSPSIDEPAVIFL